MRIDDRNNCHVQEISNLLSVLCINSLMSETLLSVNLSELLALLLPLPGILHAKAMSKHFANILQWHALDFGEAKDNKGPADETDTTVKAKST
jgi:hypothetical protein